MHEYRAGLIRVIDGDTIEVDVDLGFYIRLRTRLRLRDVNAPEITGVKKDSAEFAAGKMAKSHVEAWFFSRGADVVVRTVKAGKYHNRWAADVFAPTDETSLNDHMRDLGYV